MGKTQELYVEAAKRALARAYEGDCHRHFAVIESDETGAEGVYRKGDTLYFVTLAACSCLGSRNGQTGNLCRHSLALADLSGKLDLFIPGVYSAGEGTLTAGRSIQYVSTGTIAHIEAVNRATGEVKLTTSERVGRLEHFERALQTGRVAFIA